MAPVANQEREKDTQEGEEDPLALEEKAAEEEQDETILKDLYLNPDQPTAFTGRYHLDRLARQRGISKKIVDRFLRGEPAYTIHFPAKRRHHPSPFYNLSRLYQLVESDLISVGQIAKYNDSIQFIMVVIEGVSRKLFVETMLNKSAQESVRALKSILDRCDHRPEAFRSDRGSEYTNRLVVSLLKDRGIRQVFAHNTEKASMAERVVQTIQRRIYRYFTHHMTLRFVEVLDKIVEGYNNTPHSSTGGIPPNKVTEKDVYKIWSTYYLKKYQPSQRRIDFKIGDHVRISLHKYNFEKSFRGTFTKEIFEVSGVRGGRPTTYSVRDLSKQPVSGQFLPGELLRVDMRSEQLYEIETILDRRRRHRKWEVLVKWRNFPTSLASWEPEENIQAIHNQPT